jgi:hypothetical protein
MTYETSIYAGYFQRLAISQCSYSRLSLQQHHYDSIYFLGLSLINTITTPFGLMRDNWLYAPSRSWFINHEITPMKS